MRTRGEERWVCRHEGCDEEWPAYTTIDAERKHARARKVHPGEMCERPTKEG